MSVVKLIAMGLSVLLLGACSTVVVIQAEQAKDGIVFGVRYFIGGNGVCSSEEVELYAGKTDDFQV